MSIILPDPVTAYYIPDLNFQNPDDSQAADSQNSALTVPGERETSRGPLALEENEFWDSKSTSIAVAEDGESADEDETRRIIQIQLQPTDVTPSASLQKLENFVTVQKVESHPIKGVEGMTWCVLSVECPPDQERPSRYIAALDYAMLEGFDAIMIEPFDLSQRTQQWINIMSVVWHVFGCYLSVSVAATISSKMFDQGTVVAGVVNMLLLRYYRRYAMGDPISQYRNLDYLSQSDMDRVFHMSELLHVRGAFGSIIIKDSRRERYRYNVLKYMSGIQIGICAYKFCLGVLLAVYFPGRPL